MQPSPQSLRQRIETVSAEHAAAFPPEVLQILAKKTEEILKSAILSTCLREGQVAPDFTLPDSNGTPVHLGAALKRGPVVLSFYRGTWCPYCTLEFQALLEAMPQFRANGAAAVFAISPQVVDRHEDPGVADFTDLSDAGNHVARGFGLVYPLGDAIRRIYSDFGIRLETLNGDDSYEVPIPATYLIDRDGVVRYALANADFKERAEPKSLLEILKSLA